MPRGGHALSGILASWDTTVENLRPASATFTVAFHLLLQSDPNKSCPLLTAYHDRGETLGSHRILFVFRIVRPTTIIPKERQIPLLSRAAGDTSPVNDHCRQTLSGRRCMHFVCIR